MNPDPPRFAEADAIYNGLSESQGGKIIAADIARGFLEQFEEGGVTGRLLYSAATWKVAGAYTNQRLWKEIRNRGDRKKLLFTAGGVAAGKSTVTGKAIAEADLVFDGTMRDPQWAIQTINDALANGWEVEIIYVQRPLHLVALGAIKRADKGGRWGPYDSVPKTHLEAQQSILEIAQHFNDSENVGVEYWLNAGENIDIPPIRIERADIATNGKYSYNNNYGQDSEANGNRSNQFSGQERASGSSGAERGTRSVLLEEAGRDRQGMEQSSPRIQPDAEIRSAEDGPRVLAYGSSEREHADPIDLSSPERGNPRPKRGEGSGIQSDATREIAADGSRISEDAFRWQVRGYSADEHVRIFREAVKSGRYRSQALRLLANGNPVLEAIAGKLRPEDIDIREFESHWQKSAAQEEKENHKKDATLPLSEASNNIDPNINNVYEKVIRENHSTLRKYLADQSRDFEAAAVAADYRGDAGSGAESSEGFGGRNLSKWASATEKLIPENKYSAFPILSETTSEHTVYVGGSESRVIKKTRDLYYGEIPVPEIGAVVSRSATPAEYLHRMALQIAVFHSDLKLEGISIQGESSLLNNPTDAPHIVISQPWYKSEGPATKAKIADYLSSAGFREIPNSFFAWVREADGVVIQDATPENFILTEAGLIPIDLQMNVFTPEQMREAGLWK